MIECQTSSGVGALGFLDGPAREDQVRDKRNREPDEGSDVTQFGDRSHDVSDELLLVAEQQHRADERDHERREPAPVDVPGVVQKIQ